MPVPKMKVSRSRRNKRSANKFITMHPITECQTYRTPLASHTVCKACGYYKGTKILRTKMERANERGQARASLQMAKQATASAQPTE